MTSSSQEIDEMITTVDKNQDGKISYSEFRVGLTKLKKTELKRKILEGNLELLSVYLDLLAR